jgi:hypothetical protein
MKNESGGAAAANICIIIHTCPSMECLWGNTSIIIPKHEERAFCGKEGGKLATATTILFLDVTSFSSSRPLTEVKLA